MTADQLIELIKVLAPIAAAIIGYLTLKETQKTGRNVGVIHEEVNGRMAEAIHHASSKAHSDGVALGVKSVIANEKPAEKKNE